MSPKTQKQLKNKDIHVHVLQGSDLLHPDEGDYSSKISAVSPCAALAHPDAATPIQLPLPIKEGFGYHLVIAMQNGALAAKLVSAWWGMIS